MAVKCNIKVLDRVRQGNRLHNLQSGKDKWERDLDFWPKDTIIESVLSSFSSSLFYVIQDLMSSIHFLHREEEVRDLMKGCRLLELSVVSIWVMKDGVLFNYSRKRSCIENEKDRSKDWSLWNTKRDGSWLRCVAMDADRLSVVCKVGWKPSEGRALYSEIMWSRWSSMLWSIMSKAADKSKRASRETFLSSRARRRSSMIFRSAVSVLCLGR